MFPIKRPKPLLHLLRGDVLAADALCELCAAQYVNDQRNDLIHVLAGIVAAKQWIINMLLHVSLAIVSVHPHLRERAGWIDRWIKLTEIRLIGFNIICVRFSEVCTSGFQKSGLRIFGTLDFCFSEVLTSDFRKSGKILLWRGFWRYRPRRKTLDVQLCRPPLSLFDALD